MNSFKEQWIKYKIAEMRPEDILHYARVFGVPMTPEEAAVILQTVRNHPWSLDDTSTHQPVFDAIQQKVSPGTFKAVKQLYNQYML
ncbi:DUF2624 family protein [Salibacterium halotolerans]|uniref:Uncharacterized protein n=1 Tax=Salibacterium halotolerans TaxID=1884432 RepID=A0A1I5NHX2_9BACI|nr:DUF2624 family protein [Salibacterium halotolerans]SFP21425.1 Protein of unknown function [Salibacterium halotolerans]